MSSEVEFCSRVKPREVDYLVSEKCVWLLRGVWIIHGEGSIFPSTFVTEVSYRVVVDGFCSESVRVLSRTSTFFYFLLRGTKYKMLLRVPCVSSFVCSLCACVWLLFGGGGGMGVRLFRVLFFAIACGAF